MASERSPLLENEQVYLGLRAPYVHPMENIDIDRLFEEMLGEFGRYQKWIYFLVCLPAALTAAVTMASVFTLQIPDHRCLVPVCDSPIIPAYEDAFLLGFANFSLPAEGEGLWGSCERFIEVSNGSCVPANFSPNITTECETQLYSQQGMKSSLVTEFNLVCGKDWQVPIIESVFFAGVLVGAAVFGQLGDLIGRKNTCLVCLVLTTACGLASSFAPTYQAFAALQFFTAMGQVGVFQTAFVLAVELVGRSRRVLCGIIIEYFFVLGELLLAVLAWYFRDWRRVQLFSLLPGVAFLLFYPFLLPRSIRWLVLKRKYSEAQKVVERIAKGNGVEVPTQQHLELYKKADDEDLGGDLETIIDLIKRPRLLARLLIVCLCWIVTTMVYYGLSFNASNLGGDVFVNFILLALAEVPGYTLSYLGMTYLGRKVSMLTSLLLAGLGCLIASCLPAHLAAWQTVFFLLGKFAVTSAFGTVYLYTSELFPTTVRTVCVGLSSMSGRVGAIVSPYIMGLGPVTGQLWLPLAIFACAALLSGLATLLLPETRGRALPRNMDEAEALATRYSPIPSPSTASVNSPYDEDD